MNYKEKLNDIICESSSDYDILNNAYTYIESLEQQCKKQKEVIDKVKSLNHEISNIIYEDFLEIDDYIEHLKNKIDELIDEINNLKENKYE